MQTTIQEVQAVKTASVSAWAKPAAFAAIKSWARDLKEMTLANKKDSLTWEIVGRAAAIINDGDEYCKKIIQNIAAESGYELKELEADKVIEYFSTCFADIDKPTLVLMPQGIWSADAKEHAKAAEINAFQLSFVQILTKIPSDKHLAFVTYGNELSAIVENMRKVGGIDRRFFVDSPSLHDRGTDFLQMLPPEICEEGLCLRPDVVGQILECETDDERRTNMVALALKRLAYREDRKVNLSDLVEFCVQGTAEYIPNEDIKSPLKAIAAHEAGHAVVTMVDSDGLNIPDYAGIVPSVNYLGQVAGPYDILANTPSSLTYKYKRHQVRVLLAGRAAEQLLLGVENIAVTTASGDLRTATNIAKKLVGSSGISPTPEDEMTAGSNLLIKNEKDCSDAEKHRIENLARLYLSRQYDAVLTQLRTHRALLVAIADALVVHKVLDKARLALLAEEHGVRNVPS